MMMRLGWVLVVVSVCCCWGRVGNAQPEGNEGVAGSSD